MMTLYMYSLQGVRVLCDSTFMATTSGTRSMVLVIVWGPTLVKMECLSGSPGIKIQERRVTIL